MKTYKVVNKIKRKGFPTSSGEYKTAHAEADNAEKKKFPKGYVKLKKIDKKVKSNELVGKNTRNGNVFIEKKVPKKMRSEVAYHEKEENKAIKRLSKKSK